MVLMMLAIAILLVFIIYLLQDIRDNLYINRQIETKKKKYTREHTHISKTNFRKYIKWKNRCVCKIQKSRWII